MSSDVYSIREFQPRDYPEESHVWSEIEPGMRFSAEEIRRFDEVAFTPPMVSFKIVAEERSFGKAVAFGYLQSDIESFDPHTFWVDVAVAAEHRRRGLGLALAGAINLEAGRRNARRLWAGVRADDPRAVRFLSHQGFSERRRTWRSNLDLAGAENLPDRTELLTREGISFTTLAEENMESTEFLRDLYDLSVSTSTDEPRIGPYTPLTFERWVELEIREPWLLPEAYFLAREGGRFVALSTLRRSEVEPGTLIQAFTGTRAEFRGRGIATELKRRGLEYGRRHGYQRIRTGNDSLNHPMLAINRRMGFLPERERIVSEKDLGG